MVTSWASMISSLSLSLSPSPPQNRLEESLNLFQAICNNKFFVKTSMVSAVLGQSMTISVLSLNSSTEFLGELLEALSRCVSFSIVRSSHMAA